jgi:hypothetical protein
MKIALINHKTNYYDPINLGEYQEKVKRVIRDSRADVIVGPELALGNTASLSIYPNLRIFAEEIQEYLSSYGLNSLVVPGTGLVIGPREGILSNRALAITKDAFYNFDKKSSVVETDVATRIGLTYERQFSPASFKFRDKDVLISICRDHALAEMRTKGLRDMDLEIIVACNLPGGISPEKVTVKDRGLIIFNDGNDPNGRNCVYRMEDNKLQILNSSSNPEYDFVEVKND